MSIKNYLYVDGVEYDLWPAYEGCDPEVELTGLSANDSGGSRSLDVSLDFIHEGISGYGSTELKDDEFSSSGFTSWFEYNPGSGITIVEGSGVAHLSGTGAGISNPDIRDQIETVLWADYYFLTHAKVPIFSYPNVISGGYTLLLAPYEAVIAYYSNGIRMTILGQEEGGGYTLVSHFVDAAMDDGNWHSVGFRRHLSPACGYPVFTGETGVALDGIKFKPRDPSGTIQASTSHEVALDNIRWRPRGPGAVHTERTGPGKIALEGIEFRPNSE